MMENTEAELLVGAPPPIPHGGANHHNELTDLQELLQPPNGSPPRYVVIAKLGAGSYGAVYSARDEVTGLHVAIKKMEATSNLGDHVDQGLPVTLIREAAVLRSIHHENIVSLQEILLRTGFALFIFELCHCNLRQHIGLLKASGQTTMNIDQLKLFTCQIFSALSYCHERRIMHRDMKPDNILVDQNGSIVKIADFGMARPFAAHHDYTGRCVTSWYRPPEIILGDTQYGPSVDMWSVGCIFAEMINLCPVFRCNTEFECLILAFRFLGTPNEQSWPGVSNFPHYLASFPQWQARSAATVIEIDPALVPDAAVNLLESLLVLRPLDRISARGALDNHPFFRDNAVPDQAPPEAVPAEDPAEPIEADHELIINEDSFDSAATTASPTTTTSPLGEVPTATLLAKAATASPHEPTIEAGPSSTTACSNASFLARFTSVAPSSAVDVAAGEAATVSPRKASASSPGKAATTESNPPVSPFESRRKLATSSSGDTGPSSGAASSNASSPGSTSASPDSKAGGSAGAATRVECADRAPDGGVRVGDRRSSLRPRPPRLESSPPPKRARRRSPRTAAAAEARTPT